MTSDQTIDRLKFKLKHSQYEILRTMKQAPPFMDEYQSASWRILEQYGKTISELMVIISEYEQSRI